jgi:hypothetical protein
VGSTQPPIQWVLGTLSPEVKLQRCEADHSPKTTAEVKKMWIYTPILSYIFMAAIDLLSTRTTLPFTIQHPQVIVCLLPLTKTG